MAYLTHWYLLLVATVALPPSQGQFRELFSDVLNTARSITGAIIQRPLISTVAKAATDLTGRAIYDLTTLPIAVARFVGIRDDTPAIINENNFPGSIDDIIGEYRAGSGNSDATLRIDDLISKYGYSLEIHKTVTDDGYVLSMYRIPNNGSAVFLMHGLLGSADDYVIAGPDSSFAYLLWKEGYDVWMGNARGNKHSRQHVEIEPSEARFWDFSWHEIGCYDLPAMIDHVLNKTEKKSLKYIGHSQGTTSFFVMASERPEYNDKISLMVALSPVVFMSKARSPIIRLLTPAASVLHPVFKSIGLYEFLPDTVIVRTLKLLLCGTSPLAEVLCSNVMMLTCGFGFTELNVTNLPVVFGHVPSGASVKQLIHYSQEFFSGDFQQFDYGPEQNIDRYGSDKPPSYSLESVSAPVALIYSDEDWMSHPDDVHKLYQRLSNVIDLHKVPQEQFNHLDFLWAKNFKTLIYERLRKLFKAF